MRLKRITYKVSNRDFLVIDIFNPLHGIIPVFMGLATILAIFQAVLKGQYGFALFLSVIVVVIALVVARFLGLRRIEFDRAAGIIRLSDFFLRRSELREIQISDVDQVLFTYKTNVESGGLGHEVTAEAELHGSYLFYVGLRLSDGENVKIAAEKGSEMIVLGEKVRNWLETS